MRMMLAKIGGRILDNTSSLENCLGQMKFLLNKMDILDKIVLIPGGGNYANFVRFLDQRGELTRDYSHWMAITAMEYNGILMCKKFPFLKYIDRYSDLTRRLKSKDKEIITFGPLSFLRENDELPHSWDVTSDSIALFIANKLNCSSCYLLKDVDGIYLKDQANVRLKISTSEYRSFKDNDQLQFFPATNKLKKSQPIDNFLLNLIDKYKIECYILNGVKKSRILHFFRSKSINSSDSNDEKYYTRIYSH